MPPLAFAAFQVKPFAVSVAVIELPAVPAVIDRRVTTAPAALAVTPIVPPLRLMASERLAARVAAVLPLATWNVSPVFVFRLAVSVSTFAPFVIVTLPTPFVVVQVPESVAKLPALAAPAEAVGYTT